MIENCKDFELGNIKLLMLKARYIIIQTVDMFKRKMPH